MLQDGLKAGKKGKEGMKDMRERGKVQQIRSKNYGTWSYLRE